VELKTKLQWVYQPSRTLLRILTGDRHCCQAYTANASGEVWKAQSGVAEVRERSFGRAVVMQCITTQSDPSTTRHEHDP
jgi:hypothetical protein